MNFADMEDPEWVLYRVFILNRPLQTVAEQQRGGSVKDEDPIFELIVPKYVNEPILSIYAL